MHGIYKPDMIFQTTEVSHMGRGPMKLNTEGAN